MVHPPKRAAHKIEEVLDKSSEGKTGHKVEEATVGIKRLPDSPVPKRISPIPYHRPGTPYTKVDPPGIETEIEPEKLGASVDKTERSSR